MRVPHTEPDLINARRDNRYSCASKLWRTLCSKMEASNLFKLWGQNKLAPVQCRPGGFSSTSAVRRFCLHLCHDHEAESCASVTTTFPSSLLSSWDTSAVSSQRGTVLGPGSWKLCLHYCCFSPLPAKCCQLQEGAALLSAHLGLLLELLNLLGAWLFHTLHWLCCASKTDTGWLCLTLQQSEKSSGSCVLCPERTDCKMGPLHSDLVPLSLGQFLVPFSSFSFRVICSGEGAWALPPWQASNSLETRGANRSENVHLIWPQKVLYSHDQIEMHGCRPL